MIEISDQNMTLIIGDDGGRRHGNHQLSAHLQAHSLSGETR
jgi:hypothetical protein